MGAWPRHPCRGHSRNRTHPAFDRFPAICRCWCGWWVSTLVDTVDPRHAWMLFDQLSKYSNSNSNSNSMEIHPRMAWIHRIARICQRWGGVGVRGVSRMDAAAKPTGTYLRRPRTPAPPRHPTECVLLLLLRPLLRRVQGAALPKNTQKKTAGRGLLFRCNGAPGEIRTPDRLVRSQVLYPTELRAPIT